MTEWTQEHIKELRAAALRHGGKLPAAVRRQLAASIGTTSAAVSKKWDRIRSGSTVCRNVQAETWTAEVEAQLRAAVEREGGKLTSAVRREFAERLGISADSVKSKWERIQARRSEVQVPADLPPAPKGAPRFSREWTGFHHHREASQ